MDTQARLKNDAIASIATSTFDNLSFITYFSLYATPLLFEFLISIGKHFLLPINMAASIIHAILAWRQVNIDRNEVKKAKSHLIFRAVIETISALAISAAVIGSMFFSTLIGITSSVIFAVNCGVKTLINIGSCIYNIGKTIVAKSPATKDKYKSRAKHFALQSAAGIIATIGLTIIMVLGKTYLFGLGIASGILNLALLGVKVYALYKSKPVKAATPLLSEEEGYELRENPKQTTLDIKKSLTEKSMLTARSGVSTPFMQSARSSNEDYISARASPVHSSMWSSRLSKYSTDIASTPQREISPLTA